jgi:uncharacterized Zn-finger protein
MKNTSTTSTFTVEIINKSPFNIQEPTSQNQPLTQSNNESQSKKKNECEICKKSFSTLGNMRNHFLTIHQNYRPYKCEFPGCSKRYSILSRYQVHLRTHEGKKPFLCQICNKSFNEKGNLKTHLRFHSELRPFQCPHCTKSYKTNGHLKDHIEIQHKKIKKYVCETCNKKFGRISTLKAHIKTHTGEKNFKCKLEGCNKCFAEKGNMEIHYKRHLRKMNLLDQENLNTTKKNYGKKNIEIAFEKRIQEAIDNLKDLNSNINDENKNNEKKITHTNMKNNNNINNNKLFLNNVHNKEFISNEKFNTKNPNLIVPTFINSDSDFFRKLSGNELDKNLFKLNKEQNIINNFKENQHFISYPSLILPQDLQHLDQFNPENKNEPKIEDYGGMTRPESNVTLCNEQRPAEDAFLKEEDLESIDEGKNIQQNFFVNENYIINMPINYNYIFMDNQPNLMNGNKMLSFNFD